MKFPHSDINWEEVSLFLKNYDFQNLKSIAPVEFCVLLENCVPYEWSYWQELTEFECVVLHKGMVKCFKNNFLEHITDKFDYVFGNDVFKVLILSRLNVKKTVGNINHYSLNTKLLNQKSYPKHYHKDIQNILLVTANNNGNIGDDAITYASYDILQSIFPRANIIVDKAPASKQVINAVDLVVLGGGGIFYDNCFYNAQNYCQYFLYAHELGIRSCAFGIGALGRRTILGNELFGNALNLAEFIVVRDNNSQLALESVIKIKTPVMVKQDVAFSLISKGELTIKRNTNKPLLLFSLTDETNKRNFDNYQQAQTESIEFLIDHFEVKLLLQSKDDLNFYQQLQKQFKLDIIEVEYQNTKKIISLYQQCDLAITARLHGFIFAALAQIPTIAVATNREGSKLYRMIVESIPSAKTGFIVKNDFSLSLLQEKIDLYFKNKPPLIPCINEVKACQKLANETSDVIKKYLLD